MAESHEAHVKLTGDSSSLERAFAGSAQKADAFTGSVNKTETSAKRASDAIEKTAKSSKSLGATLVKIKGDFNGAIEIIKKATSVIDKIAESQVAAGQGTDVFTTSWLRMKAAIDDPKFWANVSNGLADLLTEMDPFMTRINEMTNSAANGAHLLGDSRRGGFGLKGFERAALRADRANEGRLGQDQLNFQMALLGSQKSGTEALEKYAEAHKRTAAAVKKDSEEMVAFKRALAEAHNEINVQLGLGREGSDTRDLESARLQAHNAAVGTQIQRRTPIDAAVQQQQAEQALDMQMRAIELSRMQDEAGAKELERIEQERSAKEEFFREQAANTDDYIARLQALEQIEQTNHEARLARIEQERINRAQAQESIVNAVETTAGVIGASTRIASMAAEASGASAKKQARAAQIGMGIQAMAIGALEVVKAAAAYASLNIPQGIAHTAAAAVAFTEGGLLLAGKIGGSAGAGLGGGGRAVGPGTGSGEPPKLPGGSNSQIPGSPGPQAPSAAGSPKSNGGSTVVLDLRGANFNGTGGRKEFARFIDEVLDEGASNRRQRRSVG